MKKKMDKDLLSMIVDKNTKALKIIYMRYEKQIYNFIYRYTGSREIAMELLQETFTRVWLAAHAYDEKKGNFKNWLYTIASNITRTEMSKKEYSYQYSEIAETDELYYENDRPMIENPEKVLERKEIKKSIIIALARLSPKLKEIIIMKNYQHLTFKQIVEITGVPDSTLKSRYIKAVALLKQNLNPMEVKKNV